MARGGNKVLHYSKISMKSRSIVVKSREERGNENAKFGDLQAGNGKCVGSCRRGDPSEKKKTVSYQKKRKNFKPPLGKEKKDEEAARYGTARTWSEKIHKSQ